MDYIFYMALLMPTLLLMYVIGFVIFNIWYRKNYMTKEATHEHDRGWHMCWDCKRVEGTMFYTSTIFGRVYRCQRCSAKKTK